jgi:hypothetical protein
MAGDDVGRHGADADDDQLTVATDGEDGPGVAVGDAQGAVVAAPDDPLPCARCHHPVVIDAPVVDQATTDGGVEPEGLVSGVDHHRHRLALPVGEGGDGGQRLLERRGIGVEADLAAGGQGVEHRAPVLACVVCPAMFPVAVPLAVIAGQEPGARVFGFLKVK